MKPTKMLGRLMGGEARHVFKGMATLAVGSGAGRLIGVASIPLLARIYSPEDYGILSVYVALVAILAPCLTLRYVQAVPLPRGDKMAANILALSCCLLLGMTFLLSLFLWLAGPSILISLSMEVLIPWLWLVVVGAIGTAVFEAFTMWATRKKAYRIIAKTQIFQSLLGEGCKLLLGALGAKPLGLLFGSFAGQSGGVTIYIKFFLLDIRSLMRNVSMSRMLFLGRYYANYPKFRLPSQILLILSVQAPLLLAAAFYDATTAGQLGLALMALALPVNLLGESMSKAFYAEISGIGRKQPDRVRRLTYAVIFRLFVLSILPACALLIGGQWFFVTAFGDQWGEAGGFASVLSIYLVFQFIQKPVACLMFVFEGQKLLLFLNAQRAILTVLSFLIGYWFGFEMLATLTLYTILVSCHYVFSTLVAIKKIPTGV